MFEKLIGADRTSDEADWIAYQYAVKHLDGYVDDDEDLDFEFAKDEALTRAESAYRFRSLPAEDQNLPDLFLKICQRKYPTHHSKQWFDEIESLARSVLAGNMKLEDIQSSSYMEFLEQECLQEELDKPPRFDLMTEKDFKAFHPRSEDEFETYQKESEFRDWCAEHEEDRDPLDPDSRARYEEIRAESGDAWWNGLDGDDRHGWADNMNRD